MKRVMAMVGMAGVAVLFATSPVLAGYDVTMELENVSGEKKTDWPVILSVYRVLGRDLAKDSVNPKGYHVYDQAGNEIPHDVDEIPPYDVPGNDELIFVIPTMEPGAKLTYRVTNTAKDSLKRAHMDLEKNPNNLIENGGFEASPDAKNPGTGKPRPSAPGWTGDASLDRTVKHSGATALLLSANKSVTAKYAKPIVLHPDSFYYFGIWSKTENVARNGGTDSRGGTINVTGFNGKDPEIHVQTQCGTRDWNKSRWFARHELKRNDWGMEEGHVQASGTSCTIEIKMDQKKQFIMDKALGQWWLDDAWFFEQPKITVRFDQALAKSLKDGCFFFQRPPAGPFGDSKGNAKRGQKPWCALPYPQEAIEKLSGLGLKGQHVPFFFGLYHEIPLSKVTLHVDGGSLTGPGGAKLTPEWIEYSTGLLGAAASANLIDMVGPVDFVDKGMRFFNVTFSVPRDAKPGLYKGQILVTADAGKLLANLPVTLVVQDLELPIIRDHYFGYIFQGGYSEAALRLYARSGFTSVAIFDRFLNYRKNANGQWEVDMADLEAKMKVLAELGIAAVNPFSDFDLAPIWNGGSLFKKSGGKPDDPATKTNYQREVKRIEAALKQHPEWPRVIYMTWDEPEPGGRWVGGSGGKNHGGPCDIMGWVPEVAPDAPHYLDCMFVLLPVIDKYYNMPGLDDPVDYACPELFDYYRKRNKDFGMASAGGPGEGSRQLGIKMATSGARYCHTWHVWSGMMENVNKKPYRSVYMVAAGQGMDDYRIWRLLTDCIKEAKTNGNAAAKAKAKEAEAYIAQVFACMNGDMVNASGGPPYLGRAFMWGYEQFYDDWQKQMTRYAAELKGVKWVE